MAVKVTKNKRFKSKRRNLRVLAVVAALLVVGGAVIWYVRASGHRPASKPTTSSGGVNLQPPTAEQKQQGESTKTTANPPATQNGGSSSTTTPPTGSDGRKQVTPLLGTITAANSGSGSGTVRGFVNGVIEDGGTCSFSFTNGSQQFTRTSAGFANAQNTQCTPITIPCTDFGGAACSGTTSPKTWTVVLTYSSATAVGTSAPGTMEVYN